LTDKETNTLVAKLTTYLFIRGIGGFGERGKVKNVYPKPPKRAADGVREMATTKNQAFIYRLSGDYNPLHVDPQMSSMGGFDVPILHGLCSYGTTARAVYDTFHKEDAQRLGKITSRFTGHVFPGETLVVEMWKEGN
jgi:acyl dehydratase